MSANTCQFSSSRELFQRKPGFMTFYTIGQLYAPRLRPRMKVKDVGLKLGISHQHVTIESYVALGKLIYGLVRVVGEVPEL